MAYKGQTETSVGTAVVDFPALTHKKVQVQQPELESVILSETLEKETDPVMINPMTDPYSA